MISILRYRFIILCLPSLLLLACSENSKEDAKEDSMDESVTASSSAAGNEIDLHFPSIASKYIICVNADSDATIFNQEEAYNGDLIGEIRLYEGTSIPGNWMECDGRFLSIENYSKLNEIISVTYGGDGRTNIRLPDLRGRIPVGAENASDLGKIGGEETLIYDKDQDGEKSVSILQPYLKINFMMKVVKSEFDFDLTIDDLTSDVGEVKMYAGTLLRSYPSKEDMYIKCSGALLKRTDYNHLFTVMGNTFGGDGREDFKVPDLRQRTPIQYSDERGFSEIGYRDGRNEIDITPNQDKYYNLSKSFILNFQIENQGNAAPRMIRMFTSKSFPKKGSENELVKQVKFENKFAVGSGNGKRLTERNVGDEFGEEMIVL